MTEATYPIKKFADLRMYIAADTGQPHQKTRKINDLGITRVLAYVYI